MQHYTSICKYCTGRWYSTWRALPLFLSSYPLPPLPRSPLLLPHPPPSSLAPPSHLKVRRNLKGPRGRVAGMVLTAHPPHLLQLTEGTVEPSAAGVDHEKDLEHSSLILVFVRVKEHLRRRCCCCWCCCCCDGCLLLLMPTLEMYYIG